LPEQQLLATVGSLELSPHHPHALLFGSGCSFGGAFAAGVTYSDEALPSAGLTDPPSRRRTPEALGRASEKREHIHPMHQAALR